MAQTRGLVAPRVLVPKFQRISPKANVKRLVSPRVATVMRGWALAERGQGEAGIAELRAAMATIRAIGTVLELPWYLALLAGAYGIVGQTAEGLDAIAEALAQVASTNERFYEAEILPRQRRATAQARRTG